MAFDHLPINETPSSSLSSSPKLFPKKNVRGLGLAQLTKTIWSTSSDEREIKSETTTSNESESSYTITNLKQNNYSSETESSLSTYNLSTDSFECGKTKSTSSESSSSNGNESYSKKKQKKYDSSFYLSPDLKVRIRTIGLIGAFLPGIGCFFCIAYTYLFQLDIVKNFTSTHCENVKRL